MKTSVNMVRKMGEFEVIQRTKDGHFDANYLLHQWNSKESNTRRRIDKFLNSSKTKEFINTIKHRESPMSKMTNGDYQVVTVIKGRNTQHGKNIDKVFMHPYLFIDFAMWINPQFKYDVVKFVHDQLIESRINSGDLTKELNEAVSKFSNVNYPQLAKALNYIVYREHEKGIRNKGSETQTKEMVDLQKKLAFSINMGYIKDYNQLLIELRRIWNKNS